MQRITLEDISEKSLYLVAVNGQESQFMHGVLLLKAIHGNSSLIARFSVPKFPGEHDILELPDGRYTAVQKLNAELSDRDVEIMKSLNIDGEGFATKKNEGKETRSSGSKLTKVKDGAECKGQLADILAAMELNKPMTVDEIADKLTFKSKQPKNKVVAFYKSVMVKKGLITLS